MTAGGCIATAAGARLPALGLGTWRMGEDPALRRREVAALKLGLDLGVGMIDTAEMYGDGAAEEIVAEALAGRRDGIFVVSKVLPHNASRDGTLAAAESSLRRLRLDCLDLYLLHWRGRHPLEGTLDAFRLLVGQGKIRHYGVSNFDVNDQQQAMELTGGEALAVNQVLYNLNRRGPERRLLPFCRQRQVGVMAYSPLEQGRLRPLQPLVDIAARHTVSPFQVALAWTLAQEGVAAIPKAIDPAHVRENIAAQDIQLTDRDHDELEAAFPVPATDTPLETL